MKAKIFTLKIIVLCSIVLTGCTKNQSLEGQYTGVFTGTYTTPYQPAEQTIIRSYIIEISNASKTRCEFTLGSVGSEMSINKKEIKGEFTTIRTNGTGHNQFPTPIKIDGIIEKNDGQFQITGRFTSTQKSISQQDSTFYTYPSNGSFIMTLN